MKYNVKTFRDAGLECKWTKTRLGAPIIAARKPLTKVWYVVGNDMWHRMVKSGAVFETFDSYTLLGDIFSVPA